MARFYKEVYRIDREGMAYGKALCGELFTGCLDKMGQLVSWKDTWFYEDTEANRQRAEDDWRIYHFARETKPEKYFNEEVL